jgi:SAM-dependent methyltransferase
MISMRGRAPGYGPRASGAARTDTLGRGGGAASFPAVSAGPLSLPPEAFDKRDPSDDGLFYRPTRLVQHLDDGARAALTARYGAVLAPGADVLDLMSSWVSHLPDAPPLGRVAGHGMNAEELRANPRLTEWWVQDLNADTWLPPEDASFDAVLCCVGVQYLQHPLAVFAEVRRVLRPGGRVIVSFSNRCFPTKAVAAWLALDMAGRAALVAAYLRGAGLADVRAGVLADGAGGDPLVAVEGRAA